MAKMVKEIRSGLSVVKDGENHFVIIRLHLQIRDDFLVLPWKGSEMFFKHRMYRDSRFNSVPCRFRGFDDDTGKVFGDCRPFQFSHV